MRNRQKLIKLLENAVYWEDEFILKYDSESFWEMMKTLPPGKFKKAERLLQANFADTRNHKIMIQRIISDIAGGKHGP